MSPYHLIYKLSDRLAARHRWINNGIRFIDAGKKLWLLSVLLNISKIKANFTNWPLFVFDCFGLVHRDRVIYEAKNGMKYKARANTIDVGVINETVVLESYLDSKFPTSRGDVIIDVGAQIGCLSLFLASFSKDIIIYAIEPQKDNFNLLCENIHLNNLDNIVPINKALLSVVRETSFYESSTNLAGHTFFPDDRGEFRKIKVQTTTLNNIVKKFKIKKIRLLKMDCEGSEYDILFNCPKKILTMIDEIVLEFHRLDTSRNEETLISFLKKNGFSDISISPFPASILRCRKK